MPVTVLIAIGCVAGVVVGSDPGIHHLRRQRHKLGQVTARRSSGRFTIQFRTVSRSTFSRLQYIAAVVFGSGRLGETFWATNSFSEQIKGIGLSKRAG